MHNHRRERERFAAMELRCEDKEGCAADICLMGITINQFQETPDEFDATTNLIKAKAVFALVLGISLSTDILYLRLLSSIAAN